MRKLNIIGIATAALSLVIAGSASATKILGYTSTSTTNVAWSGTSLSLNDSNEVITAGVGQGPTVSGQNVTFTGLVGTGYTFSGTSFDEKLSGGTFNIGSGLLTGTFTSADLQALTSSNTGQVALNGITYTGGTWFTGFGFSPTLGAAFTTTFGLVPAVNFSTYATAGGLASFSGLDSTTALSSLVATPEPASVSTFGIGALALILMAAIARRRNAGATL